MNAKETMLGAGVTLISFGSALVVNDTWAGLAAVAVGVALLYLRGILKNV